MKAKELKKLCDVDSLFGGFGTVLTAACSHTLPSGTGILADTPGAGHEHIVPSGYTAGRAPVVRPFHGILHNRR